MFLEGAADPQQVVEVALAGGEIFKILVDESLERLGLIP